MSDPTQEGGQEVKPSLNPRNAAMAQIAQQAHQIQAEDLSNFNEETGEIEQRAKEPEQEVERQEPEQQANNLEPPKKKYSLVVDGNTIEVDEDKLIEAGRRTLQKQEAADRRLQEAQRLKQQAEELLNKAKSSGPSQEDAQTAERQPAQAIEGLTPETLPTLLQGLEQRVLSTLDAKQAVQKFREEFQDIASDPDLWQLAVARNQQRIDHAAAVGEPLGDDLAAYRKIGQELRSKFAPKAVEIPADKLEKKRTITAIPAVNARAPAPQEQKTKSTSEQIEEMRKLRAQGYRTQGFSRLRSN